MTVGEVGEMSELISPVFSLGPNLLYTFGEPPLGRLQDHGRQKAQQQTTCVIWPNR